MLRSFLIYLSKANWARQIITGWDFSWRAASRFVAGETPESALEAIGRLNEKRIDCTLDHLGEHTATPENAVNATNDILLILDAIDKSGLRANVSIKLTQIGLALDEELCAQNLQRILKYAEDHQNFVRIDMEDSPWLEKTLGLYHRMRENCGCENVGIVLQSYMYRSKDDLAKILAKDGRVRLCKGAYKEPSEIAFPEKQDVDENYDRLAKQLIDGAKASGAPIVSMDGKIPPIPAIATHDDQRIAYVKAYTEEVGLPKEAMEFQMLFGIRRELQEQLASQGYPVRVYVPYGTEWYPYFTRRLAERPANLWFFLSNLFKR